MSYADLKEYGSENAVKTAGKLAQKGKTYEMVDGDIVHWKHNVSHLSLPSQLSFALTNSSLASTAFAGLERSDFRRNLRDEACNANTVNGSWSAPLAGAPRPL